MSLVMQNHYDQQDMIRDRWFECISPIMKCKKLVQYVVSS